MNMKLFSNYNVIGDMVNLKRTHKSHFGAGKINIEKDDIAASFADTMNTAVKKVNNLQIEKDNMVQKMITNPSEVNTHDVTEAILKAQFSLNFMKAIRDRVVRAYQNIVNMR